MKPLLATLALAVLGLLAWLLLGNPPQPDSPDRLRGVLRPSSEQADAPKQQPRLGDAEEPSLPAPVDQEAPTRTEVKATPEVAPEVAGVQEPVIEFAAPTEDGTLYEVRTASTDQPVPFAVITIFAPEGVQSQQAEELMSQGAGIDGILDKFGTHYKCDDKGHARIPIFSSDGLVRARGSLDGTAYSCMQEAEAEDTVLYVKAEAAFTVNVVDQAGAPVSGIAVNLSVLMGATWTETPTSGAGIFTMGSTETDALGRASLLNTFPSLGDEAEKMFSERGMSPGVMISGLYRTLQIKEVDWRETTPREMTFRRPNVGSVAVKVIDQEGAPFTEGVVMALISGEQAMMQIGPGSGNLQVSTEQDSQGRHLLRNIQVGMPFDVVCSLSTGEKIASELGCVILTNGEQLELELTSIFQALQLTGRAIDELGNPLANTLVAFGYRAGYDGMISNHLGETTTDGEGRFRTEASWMDSSPFCLYLPNGDPIEQSSDSIDPADPGSSSLDIGDVTIEPLPILAAGRVVDLDGNGVQVPLRLESIFRALSAHNIDPEMEVNLAPLAGRSYLGKEQLSAKDGTFEFRGRTPATEFTLRSDSTKYVATTVPEIAKGDEDVLFVVQQAAKFHLDINDDRAALREALNLIVIPLDENGTRVSLLDYGHGKFESGPLVPGNYKYFVAFRDAHEDAVYEGELLLAPGDDRDLGALNLQKVVYHYSLQVEMPAELEDTNLWISETPDQIAESSLKGKTRDSGGAFHVFTFDPIDQLEVRIPSGSQTFPVVEGDNFAAWKVE